MTSLEVHMKSAKEMLDDIDEKVRSGLAVERQKLVGFAASETACDLLAILLHRKNLISPGFNVIVKQGNNTDYISLFRI